MDGYDAILRLGSLSQPLSKSLRIWMLDHFPQISQDWKTECTSSLDPKAATALNTGGLESLRLNELLNLLDSNWFALSSKFFIPYDRRESIHTILKLLSLMPPNKRSMIQRSEAVETAQAFNEMFLTVDPESAEHLKLSDLAEEFRTSDLPETPEVDTTVPPDDEYSAELAPGDLVTVSGDSSTIGAVVAVTGDSYSVLVEGKVRKLYREQIAPAEQSVRKTRCPLEMVRTALVAQQINNPGSGKLYSLNSARIDFVPYQFRPALKMMRSEYGRILIADDVGVGKTIEAGLILKEMEARSSVSSVLVICPRPLVAERKWESEMLRFDETFVSLDGPGFREAIYETMRDGTWPERYSKVVIPYSLFKSDTVNGTKTKNGRILRYALDDLEQMPHFDLVIVDEAHNIRNPDTFAFHAVERFCENADAVVFMTATPLQNKSDDLYTLLHLLRPDLVIDKDIFFTMSQPNIFINRLLKTVRSQDPDWRLQAHQAVNDILSTPWGRDVIQRNPLFESAYSMIDKNDIDIKDKVKLISEIESLHTFYPIITRTRRRDIENFCLRRTETVTVRFTPLQNEIYDTLTQFEAQYLSMVHGTANVKFMMCTLLRQASSCIFALVPLLHDILNRRTEQIQEDGELYDTDADISDLDITRIKKLCSVLESRGWCESEDDPKFSQLLEIIKKKQKEPNHRTIVFSTFRNTLRYIKRRLSKAGIRTGLVDGSVPDDERYALRSRFLLDTAEENAIDVMLFSEVGCEGLDYQFCDSMINYDLPWNPMRIEQRIGRIDRRGQASDTVRIHNLITEGTIDAEVYDRCLSKIGVFEDHIGDCAEILGSLSDQIMNIMFNPALTDSERKFKMDKIAENTELKIQEMRRLEQSEKSLYGLDISEYMHTQDVQNAENKWISPGSLKTLAETYLRDEFGGEGYFKGTDKLLNMRTTVEIRTSILSKMQKSGSLNHNQAFNQWINYLKSNRPNIQVTFDSTCAKDNRSAIFLNQTHPFIKLAAEKECCLFPCIVGISISSSDIPAGDYPFLLYSWRYSGIKSDIELVPVCSNEAAESVIMRSLRTGHDLEFNESLFKNMWSSLESKHYSKWKTERENHINSVKAECRYRIDQLMQSYRLRNDVLQKMLKYANEERILRMRQGQIDKLRTDCVRKKSNLEKIPRTADITTDLIVQGVLRVSAPL